MSNKELAVQLYSAILQASAIVASNPNLKGTVSIPTHEKAVDEIAELAEMLSRIKDN